MDYPYDAQLDATTLTVLRLFRASAPSGRPNAAMLAMIADGMPADLAAWLHSYAFHSAGATVRDVWFEPRFCTRLGAVTGRYRPDVIASAARVGCDGLDLDAAIAMGNTADGEVTYAAAWREGAPKLTIVKFCLSGYADDGFVALGSFVDAIIDIAASIEDEEDVPEPLRELL